MKLDNKSEILLSIKKAVGTIKKVEKMIEDDVYCANIAQQINAAIGLLKSANSKLLEHHIKCCGAKKLLSKDKSEIDDFVKELVRVWDVSTRK
jgi:CsoR family transcriptional regulator, copper-sensing transcriptional repressor